MKIVFALSALVAMLSVDQASAMRTYLQKLPNGDKAFTQALGHASETSFDVNDFGTLYSKSGGDWAKLCKETFPGAAMTVGEAFGDPCCKWTGSGKPDFEVEPFTKPTKKTECAANKPAASTAAPAATTAAPADKPADTPTVTPAPADKATPAPAGEPDAGKPDAGEPDAAKPDAAKPDAAKPDAGKPDAGKPAGKPSKCGVKKDEKKKSKHNMKKSKKESKSLEDETDDDDDVFEYSD